MADGAAVTGKRTAQLLGAWIVFEDEAGQDLKPGKGRTWSRRGRTPLIKVTGKGSGRVLMAGMICVRPGRETRLIYRTQPTGAVPARRRASGHASSWTCLPPPVGSLAMPR